MLKTFAFLAAATAASLIAASCERNTLHLSCRAAPNVVYIFDAFEGSSKVRLQIFVDAPASFSVSADFVDGRTSPLHFDLKSDTIDAKRIAEAKKLFIDRLSSAAMKQTVTINSNIIRVSAMGSEGGKDDFGFTIDRAGSTVKLSDETKLKCANAP